MNERALLPSFRVGLELAGDVATTTTVATTPRAHLARTMSRVVTTREAREMYVYACM